MQLSSILKPAVLILAMVSITLAAVPQTINYQGILTDATGAPVADGAYSAQFTIWDSSGIFPLAVWTSGFHPVNTVNGLFTVLLGSPPHTPLPDNLFEDTSRQLGVTVGADPEMTPRTKLVTVPYAYHSLRADTAGYALSAPGATSSGWTDDGGVVRLTDASDWVGIGTASPVAPVHVLKEANSAASVSGFHTEFSNLGDGPATAGHFHIPDTGMGQKTGIFTRVESNDADTALSIGIHSVIENYGTGQSYAAKFENTVGDNDNANKHGIINDVTSRGGFSAYGYRSTVEGKVGGAAYGMNVEVTSNQGPTRGAVINSHSDFSGAYGVQLWGDAGGLGNINPAYGASIIGSHSGSGDSYGLKSQALPTGTGDAYGGYFEIPDRTFQGPGTKYGVYSIVDADQTNIVYGSYSRAINNGSGNAIGVYGTANNVGTGSHYGLFASETAGGSGAAVFASGDFIASGTKSAIMRTSQGEKLMYAVEATEVWFEDIGRAQLDNGHAHVELDALFLETVEVSQADPLQVFVQLNGDCKGTYVVTSNSSFDVHELQDGTSNAAFTYRVMAKRKGYSIERMRDTDAGAYDVNLYPERKSEIEEYWDQRSARTAQSSNQ